MDGGSCGGGGKDSRPSATFGRPRDIDDLIDMTEVAELIAYRDRKAALSSSQEIHVPRTFMYDIALSFAGENRPIVSDIAMLLSDAGIKVFYDEFEQSSLWGKDLYQHLHTVYSKHARFCMVFASDAYNAKVWTNHELRSAQERALREKGNEYILPVRLDDTTVPGIMEQVGFLDHRTLGSERIAELAIEKVRNSP